MEDDFNGPLLERLGGNHEAVESRHFGLTTAGASIDGDLRAEFSPAEDGAGTAPHGVLVSIPAWDAARQKSFHSFPQHLCQRSSPVSQYLPESALPAPCPSVCLLPVSRACLSERAGGAWGAGPAGANTWSIHALE